MTERRREALGEEARASYEAGDVRRCRELATAGLAEWPDDPALLRLAGRAGVELGLPEALADLQRLTELVPDDAGAWHELGEALVSEGRLADAGDALTRTVELRPDATAALVDLGHVAAASGRAEHAIVYLRRALAHEPASAAALAGLVHAYRATGHVPEALEAARRLVELEPVDVAVLLDVAELSLEAGDLDGAVAAFGRVRALDEEPEHEVYALHGMIEAELRRSRFRRALDLAVDATRVDRLGRTTDVLAFVVARVFGEADRPAPALREVEDALARTRAEHRRLHAEAFAG